MFIDKIKKHFTPKTRSEIIDQKITDLMHEILIHDFTNEEIVFIIRAMADDAKDLLNRRIKSMSDELNKTVKAINTL